MKKIGFLSFGHWSPDRGSATRSAQDTLLQSIDLAIAAEELGADGDLVDHENRLERDAFDPVVDHLVLVDRRRPESDLEHVVGLYRLLPGDRIGGNDRFYCDGEYDLSPLRRSGRRVLELGRSCMAPDFRGGSGMFLLWSALAEYVLDRQVEVLFGVASFHGTDAGLLAQPLSWLYRHHLAPEGMRPRARPEGYQRMDLVPEARLDRLAAEWAYLNRPDRLRDLAELNFGRLELLAMRPEAFANIDDVPMPSATLPAMASSFIVSSDGTVSGEEPL